MLNKLSWTSVIGGACFVAAAVLWIHTYDDAYAVSAATAGRGPVFFPRILLALMAVLSVWVAVNGLTEEHKRLAARQSGTVLAAIGVTAGYILTMTGLGFTLSTLLFCLALPLVLGYRRYAVILGFALVTPIVSWYIFEKIFQIILPSAAWLDLG